VESNVPVIVTNARNRIAYNVVRSLGRKGIPVYAADVGSRAMSFASRYTRGHFVYPSPYLHPDEFVDALVHQVGRLGARVLIPVFEETFLVAKHRERLSRHVGTVVPDYSQILIAHNKDAWTPIAARLGIAVPLSRSIDEMRSGLAEDALRYPVLIKPKQGGGAWGIREVSTPDELRALLARADWADRPWDRFFVQEKIAGHTHCVAMLFSEGRLRAKVAYRQLRDYPTTGGQATMRISEHHERAEADLERLLVDLEWHGVCQADFIVDEASGAPYLIDLNPRLWGSLVQAVACGVDFPYLIYRMARDGDVDPAPAFTRGVVTRWVGGELAAIPARFRAAPSKMRFMGELLSDATTSALTDDLSIADPLPFAVWGLETLLRAVRPAGARRANPDALEGVWE
jgi:predicted ATP-grasp superfamily ATP-dependent carboligase